MNELRCNNCNRLLFRYRLFGEIEVVIKCQRCKAINKIKYVRS